MRHFTSARFWACFNTLPDDIRQVALRNYDLLKQNPSHPSLQFKTVKNGAYHSVRVTWAIGPWEFPSPREFNGSGSAAMRTTIHGWDDIRWTLFEMRR